MRIIAARSRAPHQSRRHHSRSAAASASRRWSWRRWCRRELAGRRRCRQRPRQRRFRFDRTLNGSNQRLVKHFAGIFTANSRSRSGLYPPTSRTGYSHPIRAERGRRWGPVWVRTRPLHQSAHDLHTKPLTFWRIVRWGWRRACRRAFLGRIMSGVVAAMRRTLLSCTSLARRGVIALATAFASTGTRVGRDLAVTRRFRPGSTSIARNSRH